jgi:leucyl aminopeptidase
MKFSFSNESLTKVNVDAIAIGLHPGEFTKSPGFAELDKATGGAVSRTLKDEGFKGEADEVVRIAVSGGLAARYVVVVGLGAKKASERDAEALAVFAVRGAKKLGSVAIQFPASMPGEAHVRHAVQGALTGSYTYDRYLTGEKKPKVTLKSVVLLTKESAALKKAVAQGEAVARAVNLARDLVNGPPNDITPTALADAAKKHAGAAGAKVLVWNKAQIKKARMELFLAVNRGSAEEPRFVHMSYKPRGAKKKIVFVGKGLTFDAGGLCIKDAGNMLTMKCDMAGAAATIGIVMAAAELKLPVEVHGIIGCTENMLGAEAYRPGDVFTSREGKTVEIINTDAEGRLVLADCLSYAHELNPDVLIDHATLTGACMVALGPWTAGLFANDDGAAEAYLEAGQAVGESFWRLPLTDDLKPMLKSSIADMKHMGDRWGGSITAALFLREFVGKAKWIHADIAGPAYLDSAHGLQPKGGTGFGIPTAIKFLESL